MKLLCALLLSIPSAASAAGFGVDGADFLRLPVGARPSALGGAYDALAVDPYAAAFNPAGLGFVPAAGLATSYVSYLDSMSYGALSADLPLRGRGGLGADVQYFNAGTVAGTDAAGNPAGSFSGHYLSAGLAYGKAVSPRVSLGVGAKSISASIMNAKTSTYAADLGALCRVSDRVAVSAVAANLGSPLKFVQNADPLPRQYRIGGAFLAAPGLQLVGQGLYEAGGPGFNVGAEWGPLPLIALRGGYQSEAVQGLSGATGLTLGLGLRYQRTELDYSWVPMGGLGSTSLLSLVLMFGRGGGTDGGAAK